MRFELQPLSNSQLQVFCYKTLHLPGPPDSTSDPPAAPRLSGCGGTCSGKRFWRRRSPVVTEVAEVEEVSDVSEAQLPLRAHPSSEISKGLVASGLNLALCRRHSVSEEVRNQLCHPFHFPAEHASDNTNFHKSPTTLIRKWNTGPRSRCSSQELWSCARFMICIVWATGLRGSSGCLCSTGQQLHRRTQSQASKRPTDVLSLEVLLGRLFRFFVSRGCPPSNYAGGKCSLRLFLMPVCLSERGGAQRSWRWTWKKVPLSTHRSATSSGRKPEFCRFARCTVQLAD